MTEKREMAQRYAEHVASALRDHSLSGSELHRVVDRVSEIMGQLGVGIIEFNALLSDAIATSAQTQKKDE